VSARIHAALTPALALAAAVTLAHAGTAHAEESQIGVRASYVQIDAKGIRNKRYTHSRTFGADVGIQLTKHFSGTAYMENQGHTYLDGGLSLRYFPFTLAGRESVQDAYVKARYDETFKPFVSVSGVVGKIQLDTVDDLGRAELNASFYGGGGGIGVVMTLTPAFTATVGAEQTVILATNDTPVEFSATRIAAYLSVSYAF
jgi:hypothetical protein